MLGIRRGRRGRNRTVGILNGCFLTVFLSKDRVVLCWIKHYEMSTTCTM